MANYGCKVSTFPALKFGGFFGHCCDDARVPYDSFRRLAEGYFMWLKYFTPSTSGECVGDDWVTWVDMRDDLLPLTSQVLATGRTPSESCQVVFSLYLRLDVQYPPITYYCTGLLMLDHSYLVGNLTNSKIAETKAWEPPKSWHFCMSNFWTCEFRNEKRVVQD